MNEERPLREESTGGVNPWKDPTALSGVRGIYAVVFTILWILSTMLIPLADQTDWIVTFGSFLASGLLFFTRKKSGAILTVVCAIALWQVNFYGASLGAVLLAAVAGTMAGAYLITNRKFFWLVPAGCILSGVLIYLWMGNLTRALFCMVLIPAAVLLGVATIRGEWRRSTIRFAMVGILIGVLSAGVWFVIDKFGTLDRESLLALSNGWRNRTEQILLSWREELIRTARVANATGTAQQTTLAELEATVRSQYSDTALANLASTLQVILPAAILFFCQTVAYLAQKLLCGAYLTVGPKEVVQLENEYLTASVPAAILYLAAFLISFFGEATDSMFFAVAENIYLFFLPALLLVGLRVYLGRLVHATPGGRTFLLIIFFALLCCSFSSAMALLGLLGAWNAIAGAISRVARNHMEEDD